MIIRVCYFTQQGEAIAKKLYSVWEDAIFQVRPKELSLADWTQDCFKRRLPILYIGACGIAVRSVAPYVRDKLFDSPVLVMDEQGRYVIPLLSGHLGGANSLALKLAGLLGAQAVLTTATDVENIFSVDEFARMNGFEIMDREGIKLISSKLLLGERISVAVDPAILCENVGEMPENLELVPFDTKAVDLRILGRKSEKSEMIGERTQTMRLVAKEIVVGMGCKKGKSFEELRDFLMRHCPYDPETQVYGIASIDLKKREEGLWGIAQFYHVPFVTYSGKELDSVEGEFDESDFVREITGVSNVCERAAVALAGNGVLLQRKIAEDGMTLAIAERKPRIMAWEKGTDKGNH